MFGISKINMPDYTHAQSYKFHEWNLMACGATYRADSRS